LHLVGSSILFYVI